MKHSAIGTLDRSLGFAFGVVRGLAIIGLAYIAFTTVIPVKSQPAMVADAKLLPVVQVSAQALLSCLVPIRSGQAWPRTASAATQCATADVGPDLGDVRRPFPRQSPIRRTEAIAAKRLWRLLSGSQLDNLIDSTSGNGKP